jgi:hypothetical protein
LTLIKIYSIINNVNGNIRLHYPSQNFIFGGKLMEYKIPEENLRKIRAACAAGQQAAANAKQVLAAEAAAIEAVQKVRVNIPEPAARPAP